MMPTSEANEMAIFDFGILGTTVTHVYYPQREIQNDVKWSCRIVPFLRVLFSSLSLGHPFQPVLVRAGTEVGKGMRSKNGIGLKVASATPIVWLTISCPWIIILFEICDQFDIYSTTELVQRQSAELPKEDIMVRDRALNSDVFWILLVQNFWSHA